MNGRLERHVLLRDRDALELERLDAPRLEHTHVPLAALIVRRCSPWLGDCRWTRDCSSCTLLNELLRQLRRALLSSSPLQAGRCGASSARSSGCCGRCRCRPRRRRRRRHRRRRRRNTRGHIRHDGEDCGGRGAQPGAPFARHSGPPFHTTTKERPHFYEK